MASRTERPDTLEELEERVARIERKFGHRSEMLLEHEKEFIQEHPIMVLGTIFLGGIVLGLLLARGSRD